MFAHFFIDRPIFAMVVSLVIVIAGGVAMFSLPIAQYPDITPVQIQVTATYPGADADTLAQNVGAPIEQQVNGADNMIYMQSTSSSTGNYTLNVYFEQGTDPSLAQVDVQNRVQWATPQLPSSVSAQGVIVKKTTASFMMIIALYSPDGRYDPDFIANYTNINVLDAIKRIEGANQAAILGVPDYAMRIWLRPDRMAQLDITATDEQLGKPAGHDIVEGVYTLPVLRTLALRTSAAAELADLLGSPLDTVQQDKALAILRSNDGIESAIETAHEYVARAVAACDDFPDSAATEALREAPRALITSVSVAA